MIDALRSVKRGRYSSWPLSTTLTKPNMWSSSRWFRFMQMTR